MTWNDMVDTAGREAGRVLLLFVGLTLSLLMLTFLAKRARAASVLGNDLAWRHATIPAAPMERVMPRRARLMFGLAVIFACAIWLVGFAITPNRDKFLAAREWQFQPAYVVAHWMALHYFVRVFAMNFRQALRAVDMAGIDVAPWLGRVLGLSGIVVAALVATPFCLSDYGYVTTGSYDRMGGGNTVSGVDLLLWGLWCLEWFINALIWVILVAFLYKNSSIILGQRFVDPIEVVILDRKYRPFLQMSAQGATVVLGFSIVTVAYIGYAGGEITDYLGLTVTGVLLLGGFLVPWLLLRSKVRRAIAEERRFLMKSVVRNPTSAIAVVAAEGNAIGALEQRLDNALVFLRLAHLDGLHVDLGRTEFRAIMVRLMAPVLTIAWQASQHWGDLSAKLGGVLKAAQATLRTIVH
jgi:hypothetical protein